MNYNCSKSHLTSKKIFKFQNTTRKYHHIVRYKLVPRPPKIEVLLLLLGLVSEVLLLARDLVRELLIPPRDFLLPHDEDIEENDFFEKVPDCIFLLMSSPIRRNLSATNWHRISSLALNLDITLIGLLKMYCSQESI